MRSSLFIGVVLTSTLVISTLPPNQFPLFETGNSKHENDASLSQSLYDELEELARVVDISYCVGTTGIHKPFSCLGRCHDFPTFELVKTWETGPLLSDSCGFIALDHNESSPRIIIAFRGTYSLANTLIDLSTIPQEYVPYPDDKPSDISDSAATCANCTVHSGFWTSWKNTRESIMHHVQLATATYPDYKINLVGHSLGGAVALLAGLELKARGWPAYITTFGEPKVGNAAFVAYVDRQLVNEASQRANLASLTYRRVTHVDDPVPLLPLTEWGYRPHAGEIYISKAQLPPDADDLRLCMGDADKECSAGADSTMIRDSQSIATSSWSQLNLATRRSYDSVSKAKDSSARSETWGGFSTRLKLWQLFFAHRDYFWRLGVCFHVPDDNV